ncbi:Putative F0F1-ATPase subunit Ca2+/Mg2+ transporter [Halobacillus dabanensis]|uniref:Putative F0F1-ATPase subunit Ca2+/Mg2+ transporter n=1 Tax=Halobacillus dabanensis TaxID=240302 RepID=A0A1I3X7V8_HALDA|nr:AtpZ/AtpI family protein [Halobacillus dabanensis]SFK15379.1 Putative F0F1-ATPase subunit Ca2+/Mg2+ transporter [Halobacillus dabanensis]
MKHNESPFKAMALTSSIVSQLAGGPLAGVFLGKWVDERFSTEPIFLIIGLFLGLGAGTYGTIHLVRTYTGDD